MAKCPQFYLFLLTIFMEASDRSPFASQVRSGALLLLSP
ncbi:Uncharacterized protein dnl_41770 [Desulfonema limicola]|uniref:Uncharacterized protein n=1 Tax=Desulfonema limicola TaxID=45656 RepID=A0A975BA72_9BACT|nr:Uncharacterized protein dnl_41770 [Desulfonema limicola]